MDSAKFKTGFYRLPQVLEMIPISRSSFYSGISRGVYPRPVKLGLRTSAWRAEDIEELITRLGSQPFVMEGGK